ncbi:MAG: hypothetical protein ONB46_13170 [candidate division KSB1 bacterium]|nr:hypothetical protein [candidate division KSB1 bacterium]MDZ7366727.1 hypothetical protein [candidate division KSB1 bacterium]MDZ7404740.1 hypothetical protein [candidate division KSB1 bacterium]
MNVKKCVIASLAVGVALNVYDFIAHGQILASMYYSKLTTLMRQDAPMHWFIIGDFVAGFVFVWVYDRVYGSFGGGLKGGATYGLYGWYSRFFPGAALQSSGYRQLPLRPGVGLDHCWRYRRPHRRRGSRGVVQEVSRLELVF